jgi:hypothetical protein
MSTSPDADVQAPTIEAVNDQLKRMNDLADKFKEMLATLSMSINTIVAQSAANAEKIFLETLTKPYDLPLDDLEAESMLAELEALTAEVPPVRSAGPPLPLPLPLPLQQVKRDQTVSPVVLQGASQPPSFPGHTDFG